MKNDLQNSYEEMLASMIQAQEQMQEFIDLVEVADKEGKCSTQLKLRTSRFKDNLYTQIKDFLQDNTLPISSSDIAYAIDELEFEDEDEDEDEIEAYYRQNE